MLGNESKTYFINGIGVIDLDHCTIENVRSDKVLYLSSLYVLEKLVLLVPITTQYGTSKNL